MTDSASSQLALRATLDERLAARDRAGAVSAVRDAVTEGRIDIDSLYTHVLVPLLIDTGAAWQQGSKRVWEEHFATATVRTIVESLYLEVAEQAKQRPRLGKTVILACPAGEQHELGLRMLADRMTLAGWDAHFLGADTPAAEIAAAATALNAELVALSAATHYNRLLLREVLDELHRLLPNARIGVGGPAFAHDGSMQPDELLTEADLGLVPPAETGGD